MSNGNGAPAASAESLVTIICKEWPALDAARVSELVSDDEKLTGYVAEQTKHTRTLVGMQLTELRDVAGGRKPHSDGDRLVALVERLESRANELLGQARRDLAESARISVEKNPWMSLGIAALVGIIVGFWFRGGGRDR